MAPPGVGAAAGMGAVQMDALRRALDAHLASRGSCRVSPEEALWVEAALERQEDTFFADQGFQAPPRPAQRPAPPRRCPPAARRPPPAARRPPPAAAAGTWR
jgi:hypothetical protein